jgi:hypothetical protein
MLVAENRTAWNFSPGSYLDPDFEESYFAGHYDVTCRECGGKRVVPECLTGVVARWRPPNDRPPQVREWCALDRAMHPDFSREETAAVAPSSRNSVISASPSAPHMTRRVARWRLVIRSAAGPSDGFSGKKDISSCE